MNKETAAKISALMLDLSGRLDESVALVEQECEQDELVVYRRAVGNVLGEIWDGILNPLYEAHPEMRPDELDDA
jgi:hypothetical protein